MEQVYAAAVAMAAAMPRDLVISVSGTASGAKDVQGAGKAKEDDSFGKLVQKKRQDKEPQETESKDNTKAEQTNDEPVRKEEEPTEDQNVLAAGLMAEYRPEIQYITAEEKTDSVAVEIQPEVQNEGGEQVQAELPQLETPVETKTGEQVETKEAVPEYQTAETQVTESRTEARSETGRTEEIQVNRTSEEDTPEETAVEADTQVFTEVETVPVKVAEPVREPVELDAPEGTEKLAKELLTAVEVGEDRVEITLVPENLGKVTVEITRAEDGKISVIMSAQNPKTTALLQKHADGLENLMASGTKNEVRVEVQREGETPRQFLNPNGDENAREQQHQQRQRREEHKSSGEDFLHRLRLGLTGLDGIA